MKMLQINILLLSLKYIYESGSQSVCCRRYRKTEVGKLSYIRFNATYGSQSLHVGITLR